MKSSPDVALFTLNGSWLGLYSLESLAEDAMVSAQGSGFKGFTLAHNVASEAEVDQVMALALSAGKHCKTCTESILARLFRVL